MMSMNIDFLYHALKYVALVLTAVIALIALRKKTIAESGGLTKAGRWYSTFIIAAVLVAIGTQLLDDMRQARSTSEQLKRNAELLEQVIRGQRIQVSGKTVDKFFRFSTSEELRWSSMFIQGGLISCKGRCSSMNSNSSSAPFKPFGCPRSALLYINFPMVISRTSLCFRKRSRKFLLFNAATGEGRANKTLQPTSRASKRFEIPNGLLARLAAQR